MRISSVILVLAFLGAFSTSQGQQIAYTSSVFATTSSSPNGIAVDSAGNVYISVGNAVERAVAGSSNGFSVFAGSVDSPGWADGPGASALFNAPVGLAADRSGNIYVADAGNNAIRKITPLGAVSTIAGLTMGFQDGTGLNAYFNDPTNLAVNSAGDIYVVDTGNNALRRVTPGGVTSTLPALPPTNYNNNVAEVDQLICVAVDPNDVVHVAGTAYPFIGSVAQGPYLYFWTLSDSDTYSAYFNGALPYGVVGTNPLTMVFDQQGTSYIGSGDVVSVQESNGIDGGFLVGTSPPGMFSANISGVGVDGNGNIFVAAPRLSQVIKAVPVGILPYIETAPVGGTIAFGSSITLNVTLGGTPTPTCQWQIDGVNIPGATSLSYVASMPGTYSVVATSSASSSTGGDAVVTAATRLENISSRASVGTSGDMEIAGFVITGPPGTTEQVLVRAAGPSLSPYGVTGFLSQPELTLLDSKGNELATNTGWSSATNASEILAAFPSTGAFPFPLDSADSAILINLPPGAYTAQVTGVGGATGVALAEVYEVAKGDPELVNISTRAYVGTGTSVEIGGFVVTGTQNSKVLIRAIGPSLGQFGVTGVLAQPTLNVFDGAGNLVAANTGWSTNANPASVASEMAAAGAFALPSGSADCALVLTLAPGAYTAVVSGLNGTSGVALVEVYQAP